MKVHKIRLVDNVFDLLTADELINMFIAAKTAFLENRIMETDANNKKAINQLKSRINDLKAESRSLKLFIEAHEGENVELEVGSTIVMSIKDSLAK